jgi:transposase
MRVIGMDIHRTFAEAVMIDGDRLTRLGRVNMSGDHLAAFAAKLTHEDHIVVEATGNAQAVVEAVAPFVGRVVIANPRQVHLIAKARIKTDVIDATVLARLYASGFLPEVWVPDARTMSLRRQVTRRNQVVRQRVRLKTMIQAILHAHLVPQCPHADIAGPKGRAWLLVQVLPGGEINAIERHLREYDRLADDLRVLERELARDALASAETTRLMTIPGIDMVVAIGLLAAIGPVDRFASPGRLVAFLGLNPSVHQSGNSPARHGSTCLRCCASFVNLEGPCHARTLLVEAAWQAIRGPGPLRAFYERVRGRRGTHVAAVAVARKIAVIVWHLLTRGEDYAWVRPALHAKKLRDLELRSGQPARRGQRGAAYEYNLTKSRQEERQRGELAEAAYKRFTEGWTKRGRRVPAGASEEVRQ